MNKLWAFGDSHIAGSGLANYTHDTVQNWLIKKTGFSSYYEYDRHTGFNEKKTEVLLRTWNKKCKNKNYPENSYAGRIASYLNYSLNSRANPGTGIDYSFKEIRKHENKIDWNNDIVLLNLPPVYRYISTNNGAIQYSLMSKMQYQTAPSLKTMEDIYVAMYFYIREHYPKIKIIHITDLSLFNDDLQKICTGDNTVYVDNHKNQFDNPNTPCGHWINELHDIFAKELIEDLRL